MAPLLKYICQYSNFKICLLFIVCCSLFTINCDAQITIPTMGSGTMPTILTVSYDTKASTTLGNPGAKNLEADNGSTGWTTLIAAGKLFNTWSTQQTLPITFSFWGSSVTKYYVNQNGLIYFTTSTTSPSIVTGDNTNLPSATLTTTPFIACYWDQFTSAPPTSLTSVVRYKVFGASPNRQLWIKWTSYEIGKTPADKCTFACVLQETSNKIYLVDMTKGTSAIKSTLGMQTGSSAVQYNDSLVNLSSATTAYTDNTYIEFAPFNLYPRATSATYSTSSLTSATTSHLFPSSGDVCLENELDAAAIKATLNLGNVYNYGANNFMTYVTLNIIGYNSIHVNHATTKVFNITKTLMLNKSHPEEVFYADISSQYSSVQRIDYNISAYHPSDTVKKDIALKAELVESFNVNVLSNGYDLTPMVAVQKLTSPCKRNPVTLRWTTTCSNAPNYEVQILRLLNTSSTYMNDTDKVLTTIDWSKALDIETQSSSTSLKLALTEGSGFYIWRVRPIGTYYEGGIADSRNWGLWSTAPDDGAAIHFLSTNPPKDYAFYYQQFDEDKNWIYSRYFSEGNKIKESMGYANGLNLNTQNQIHFQSKDTVVVSQQVYDYCGLPVVKSLAAPNGKAALGYSKNFMLDKSGKLFSAKNFDEDANYTNPDSLASGRLYNYYSNNNTDTTIPIGNGYLYSRTLYYPDGLGRVQEEGGVGKAHHLGSTESGTNRTMKFYVSSVSNDELIWIFGDEASKDTTVFKEIAEDPNKVISVAYKTYAGQTIATCLAKNGDKNDLLDELESRADAGSTVTDTVTGDRSSGDYSITREKSLLVVEPTGIDLAIHYDLSPSEIEAECVAYCQTCDYTVVVYVKDMSDLTDQSMFDTIIVPAQSCSVGSTVTPYNATYHLDKGSYTVGRMLIANNENSSTGNLYLDDHLSAVDSLMDIQNEEFDTLFSLLDSADLDGFYGYLVDHYGVTQEQIDTAVEVTISTADSCCSIVIPINHCEEISCDDLTTDANGNYDVEKLLFQMNGKDVGSHVYQYFYDINGDMKYPLNAGSYWYVSFNDIIGFAELGLAIQSDSMDTATVLLPFDVTAHTGTLIGSGIASGNSQASTAASAIEYYFSTLYDNTADYPYTVYAYDDTLYIYPKFNAGTYFGGSLLVYPYMSTNIKGRSHGETVVEIGNYPWGDGAFNAMFTHMVADGYDCDTILSIAYAYFAAYKTMQYDDSSPDSAKNAFDLLESFLTQAGKQYKGFNKDPYDAKGYLEYAYEYFDYDTTYPATSSLSDRDSTCEEMYDMDSLVAAHHQDNRFDSISDKPWEAFYQCINGDWSSSSLTSSLTSCDDYDYDCIVSMTELLIDSCDYLCEQRRQSFYDECLALYGDTIKAWCLAEALVEHCKGNCALTVSYHIDDWNTDGINDTIVDSAGTAAEVEAMMMSIAYAFDVKATIFIAGKPRCSDGYDLVLGNKARHSDILVDMLNEDLTELRNSMTTTYRDIEYNVIKHWIAETAMLTKDCDLEQFNTIGGLPLSIRVYQNAVSYPSEFVIIGNTLYYNQEFDGSLIDLIKGINECDSTDFCGAVCFKWVAPVVDTAQTSLAYVPCEQGIAAIIKLALQKQLDSCIYMKQVKFQAAYMNNCLHNIVDHFVISYALGYYHYTLSYFDRAGNLVKTVPPKGVDFDDTRTRADHPNHTLTTTYTYNSLKQLMYRESPDGGISNFYYDNTGQIRFSQNAKQKAQKAYSYIKYDDLGRAIEAGQSDQAYLTFTSKVDDSAFPLSGTDKVFSTYSTSHPEAVYLDGSVQEFIQNRISYTIADKDGDTTTTITDQVRTYYSYDPHGNVEWMIQKLPGLSLKFIAYEYDLISGKVTKVKFNEGKTDQFYHRYTYDEDNRISYVETSRDEIIWDKDISYQYYIHGPLKRAEIGDDHIQGLDYVYTLQGWLKAENSVSFSKTDDPGHDGKVGGAHSDFAPDAFGMMFSYYKNDFSHNGSAFNNSSSYSANLTSHNPLYNGTIAAWASNSQKTSSASVQYDGKANLQYFSYDELTRLTGSIFQTFNTTTSKWTTPAGNDFKTIASYDENGNIDTLQRNAYGSSSKMDNLLYHYKNGTNQLSYIDDIYGQPFVTDLADQSAGNYSYNQIGELTKDVANGITRIRWNTVGKPDSIVKSDGSKIAFLYDANGNKIKQTDISSTGTTTNTYYVCDATGNINGIYSDTLLSELPIYAASRIGEVMPALQKGDVLDGVDSIYERSLGKKYYELKDHLNNVRVLVTDVKASTIAATTYKPGNYSTTLSAITDFYPYGMQMPGRSYNSSNYRFGYNGMEKNADVAADGNEYSTLFRQYDPRVGRWFSNDPKFNPSESPYAAMSNNPIMNTDPLGDTSMVFTLDYGYYTTGDYENNGPDYKLVTASNPVLTNLDESGVKIVVINHEGEVVGNFQFNDPRDVGNRTKPDGTPIESINRVILNANDIVDQNLSYVSTKKANGEEMSFSERWHYAYEEGQMGKLDFSRILNSEDLAIVDGVAYNRFDFGNFTWGAAMTKLGFTRASLWAGSNGNAFANEKHQNQIDVIGDDQEWTNTDRYTWRGTWNDPFHFDEEYDQKAIFKGADYQDLSSDPYHGRRSCSVPKTYVPDKQ